MESLLDAFRSLDDRFSAILWGPLALALLLQLVRLGARSRAWRNVLAFAYSEAVVRWRSVFAAYAAGVGVNTVLPARGGDVVRLYLAHRAIPSSTYPTLASSLAVEAVFDSLAGAAFLAWAVATGQLPGLDALDRLPSIDWLWVFQAPRVGAALAFASLILGFAVGIWSARAGQRLWARLAQGVAVLREPRVYLRRVVSWQAVDWTLRLVATGLFLHAFRIPVTPQNVALVQVTQSLSTLLPLTPAGIGTEQALLVFVLAGEASAGSILAFSAGMRVAGGALNVMVASIVLFAVLRTVRWRRVIGDAGADAESDSASSGE